MAIRSHPRFPNRPIGRNTGKTMKFLRFPLIPIALFALLASGCASYAKKDKAIPQAKVEVALDAIVAKHCTPFMDDFKSVGLAVAVVSGDHETIMTFGRPAIKAKDAVTPDTIFEIGSITKTFTGLLLACQVEAGRLKIDQPVRELLPKGMELSKPAQEITLRQLTTHTAGFPRLPENLSYWGSVGKMMIGGNPYGDYTDAQFREAVRTVQLDQTPGSAFAYSNFSTALLGYILAFRAGLTYEALVNQQICHPLGLHDTAATLSPEQAKRFAQGYSSISSFFGVLQYHESDSWNMTGPFAGAGCIRSSAKDMQIYLRNQMRPEGELKGPITRSHQELYRETGGPAVAMNWFLVQNAAINRTILWHNGLTGGHHSYIGFTSDGQTGVVILANVADAPVEELGVKILEEVATTPLKPAAAPVAAPPPAP